MERLTPRELALIPGGGPEAAALIERYGLERLVNPDFTLEAAPVKTRRRRRRRCGCGKKKRRV
jgi:hypothetical protein